MSFLKMKSWDNRKVALRMHLQNGRMWSRRVQWLEDAAGNIKLKFEDYITIPAHYRERLFDAAGAAIAWSRFKEGQPTDDCVSVYGTVVPTSLQSMRAAQT